MSDDPLLNVRARILTAAVDLFAEQGYAATSVQQVVARAGVTKGALYHYFGAKEDLLFEIYHSFFAEQLARLHHILGRDASPEVMLRTIIDDLVLGTAANVRAAAVFTRETPHLDQQRWLRLQDEWRSYQDAVRGLIREAQEAGTFSSVASPETVSWTVFGFTNALHTWYRPEGPKSAVEISAELADLVLAGLQPKGGTR